MSLTADVCVITEATAFGGAEMHTVGLITELLDRGYSVVLVECGSGFYSSHLHQLAGRNFTYLQSPDRTTQVDRGGLRRWRARLAGIQAQVAVIPRGDVLRGDLAFFWLCRRRFGSVYVIQHTQAPPFPRPGPRKLAGIVPLGFGWWWRKIILGRFLSSFLADRTIAVARCVKQGLVENFHYRANRVVVIRNGVPVERFRRDQDLGNSMRKAWRVPEQAFVFGMLTRFTAEKGIDVALAAVAGLVQVADRSRFRLVVTGKGPLEQAAREQARELGIDDVVLFAPFANDTRKVLSAYDAILLPSRLEALPLSLLEGMAAACIPIVSRVGDMPDVVATANLGWVVPPDDSAALGGAMAQLLELGAAELSVMRQSAVEHVTRHHEAAGCFGRIADLILPRP
jgi:glycosyltransferase involved in cell wall biosynthesis